MVDAAWPNLPNYREFSPADHAAHTSPKGIVVADAVKDAKTLMKVARKPHLKLSKITKVSKPRMRRKKLK